MVWKTDTQMEATLGEWWTQEMEMHEEATMLDNVQTANNELASRNIATRVVNCVEDDDELIWEIQL